MVGLLNYDYLNIFMMGVLRFDFVAEASVVVLTMSLETGWTLFDFNYDFWGVGLMDLKDPFICIQLV